MRILLLNGQNLDMLGVREPHIYGHDTLADIVGRVEKRAAELGVELVPFQSNHEGALLDFIHAEQGRSDGMIINPGGLSHYGIGLRDAISGSSLPTIEVHISNVHAREPFRNTLAISAVCRGVITGLGWRGYIYALEQLVAAAQEAKK